MRALGMASFDFTANEAIRWDFSSTTVTQKRSPVIAAGEMGPTVSTCTLSNTLSAGLEEAGKGGENVSLVYMTHTGENTLSMEQGTH
jgi:hypothetical protein